MCRKKIFSSKGDAVQRALKMLAINLIVLCFSNISIGQTNYYVSTTGTDNVGCGTIGSPCASVQYVHDNKLTPLAGDTIKINTGTYNEFDITLSTDCVIDGAGSENTIFDGLSGTNNDRRCFNITEGSIYIHNLAIQNYDVTGKASASLRNGGGIYIVDVAGEVQVIDCYIDSCRADRGGAMFTQTFAGATGNVQTAVTISNCMFRSDTCDTGTKRGGAVVFDDDNATGFIKGYIDNGTTFGDTAKGNFAATLGGAISFEGTAPLDSDLYLDSIFIQYNEATTKGGAIWFLGDTLQLSNDVTIRYNTTETGDGGGLFLHQGTAIIADAVFHNNVAENNGGGLYIHNPSVAAEITRTAFYRNKADGSTGDGGAIFVSATPIELENSLFFEDSACQTGGAILVNNTTADIYQLYL